MEFCPYYMIFIKERSIVIMLNYLGDEKSGSIHTVSG